MISPLRALQPLGRALMLPIAVLPAAGLLLRLGQPDLLDIAFVSAAGEAIFTHLGLLFAIGVATGFARDGNGAACMAGVVCFLIATLGAQSLMAVPAEAAAGLSGDAAKLAIAAWKAKAIARLDVPIGIASGLIGGLFYNRFSTIALPDYLAFFGGRRFVPIVSGLAGLGIALIVGPGFAVLNGGIDQLSWGVVQAGPVGLFLFGLLNRLLLVTGLHHLLNNIAWFVVGDWHGTTGDLRRFFAGDPQAGVFMTGFFPVMMFGLPAACLAMYHAARPDRRKAVGGMLLSLALTSALTGVTEPIEFSFMFLAPLLYAIHAVLTGLSMALTQALGMKLGFGFSAGLFDYVLNYGKATRPLLLLPFGLAYAALYYGLFRFFIARFDLATPGREPGAAIATPPATISGSRGDRFVAALGGRDNLVEVGACTTRLRLGVRDDARIDDAALKALGARGLIRPTRGQVQVVLGPIADQVAVEMRDAMAAPAPAPVAEPSSGFAGLPGVVAVSEHPGRVRLTLADGAILTDADLIAAGARAVARPAPGIVHVITG